MSRVTGAHIEARRQSILEAAFRVFALRGVNAATMAEIAEEAGLSAGALYRYFPSKQDLAAACFREGAEQVTEQWRLQVEAAPDPSEAFFRIARESFDEIMTPESRDHTRLMLEAYLEATRSDAQVRAAARDEHATIVRGLALMLSRVQESGRLPKTLDVEGLAGALCAFWLGARIFRLLDPEADILGQLEAVGALIAAATPHPAAAGRQPSAR